MSYILDALKKIELEKNKKIRPDGRINISGELFQERKLHVSSTRIWKVSAMIVLASLVTGAGTWYILRGDGRQSAARIRPASSMPHVPVNPPALRADIPVPAQPPLPPVAMTPAAPTSVADDGFTARGVRHLKKQVKVRPLSPDQPAQAAQAPADVKLSGIAWQDDRSARRAVVNGFLLKEGSVVSGAKITDIQADRVRFSSAAGQFELKLDAGLSAGVQR